MLLFMAAYFSYNNAGAFSSLEKAPVVMPDTEKKNEPGHEDENVPPSTMPDINGEKGPDFFQENAEQLFLIGADPVVAVAEWLKAAT